MYLLLCYLVSSLMRAAIDGILLSADLRHLTRYNEISFPEFQRFS